MFIWPAVVDLPTPPLPEATTTTCLTPCIDFLLGSPRAMRSFWCSSNDGLRCLVPLRIKKQKNTVIQLQWVPLLFMSTFSRKYPNQSSPTIKELLLNLSLLLWYFSFRDTPHPLLVFLSELTFPSEVGPFLKLCTIKPVGEKNELPGPLEVILSERKVYQLMLLLINCIPY